MMTRKTLPAHVIWKDEHEMDSDDGDIQVSKAPPNLEEVVWYDPGGLSQAWWLLLVPCFQYRSYIHGIKSWVCSILFAPYLMIGLFNQLEK